MILKGNQRGHGSDLAIHLMNGFDNESIEIAEVKGAVAADLYGAFAEFEAVALGTKARKYLYSLSISPPAKLTREQYAEAIDAIEERLGLTGQPRAVVYHVKYGREHCHVVWSRIDIDRMRAVHMAHDRRRLMDLACELSRKFGLELPPGLKAWEAKQKYERERLDPSLAEKAQAEETGVTPEQRREEITAAYERSDTAEAFRAALEQKGYVLARGDRRGFVVVDQFGNPHSLTRYINGHKAGEIKKKLAALDPAQLPSVDEAKELISRRIQALDERQREQDRDQEREDAQERERVRREELHRQKQEALAGKQAERRLELAQAEQELLTRQQAERLALHAAQKSERRSILFRVRSAVADLIRRTPGLRAVLAHIQKLTHLDPKERHRLESDALIRRHAREKRDIERRRRMLGHLEKRENRGLPLAVQRELRLQEAARLERERAAEQARSVDNMAMQDFYEAARDQGLWKPREFQDGELSESFNDAAEFVEGAGESDDDDGHAPDWKDSADDDGDDGGPRHRRRPGKGYGYRKGSD